MKTPRPQPFDPQRPTPELLLAAYASGVFPMDHDGVIEWFDPDPRAILPLDAVHVPRSLRRVVRSRPFTIRTDTAFAEVMRACAQPRADDHTGTWIDDRLIAAYSQLHARGHAHSVEAWRDGRLVGGLYGVVLGGAFFGESMFIRPEDGGTNASKVCLVALVEHLVRQGFTLLDVQFVNPHLEQFGIVEIPRRVYLARLERAIRAPVSWGDFTPVEARPG